MSRYAGGWAQSLPFKPCLRCQDLCETFEGCPYSWPDASRPLRNVSRYILDDFLPRAGTDIYFKRQLLHRSLQERRIDLLTLTAIPHGKDLEQLPMDLPCAKEAGSVAKCPERPIVFISARVHPGETPGQFVFLGLLRFLLSEDPRAGALRHRFLFKLVPMLNPDGVAMGHSAACSEELLAVGGLVLRAIDR